MTELNKDLSSRLEMLAQAGDVASVVAVTWPEQQRDPLLEYRGPWVVDMP